MEDMIGHAADVWTVIEALRTLYAKYGRGLQQAVDIPGVVPRGHLGRKRRLRGEAFAAEILTEPVHIEQGDHPSATRVVVDRRHVANAVVSTEGKRNLCEAYVKPHRDELVALDRLIHRTLARSGSEVRSSLALPPLPFRWASGGVLSLVTYRGEEWVPLFFRDIPPVGWNLSLGSSERLIDHDGRVFSPLDHELSIPCLFILREFTEETLVIDREPSRFQPRDFSFVLPYDLTAEQRHVSRHLAENHRRLRQTHDHIEIEHSHDLRVPVQMQTTPMELTVCAPDGQASTNNVLVCINCLELGIEVVRVLRYSLPEGAYFLDGETLENDAVHPPQRNELVRMPIALISQRYLKGLFSKDLTLDYQAGVQCSFDFGKSVPPSECVLFPWDVQRRLEISRKGELAVGREHTRYQAWEKTYARYFVNDRGDVQKGALPSLFTPTTAKALNLLFRSMESKQEKHGSEARTTACNSTARKSRRG